MNMKTLVYIIEDDVDILSMLATLLLKNGFEIYADWNGNDFDNKTYYGPSPDIYIMDIKLYGKNGLDLCRKVKGLDAPKPVLLISANQNIAEEASSAGADAFVEKPFDLMYLIEQLHQLTGNLKQHQNATGLGNI